MDDSSAIYMENKCVKEGKKTMKVMRDDKEPPAFSFSISSGENEIEDKGIELDEGEAPKMMTTSKLKKKEKL